MGVTGLWRLVEPSGNPVPLETLENKVLAIDISIWLHQAIKGFQDSQGATLPNAHLLGIYHRVCKLLYFRIKPIFVFDGGVPHLKKKTLIKRQQQRSKKLTEAEKIQQQLLTTLLKQSVITNLLIEKRNANLISTNTSPTKTSPKKAKSPAKAKESDNLYKLPPTNFSTSITSSDEETSESDYSPTKNWDLHTINEKSEHFKSLPADVRHDILTELKATRKQSSWGKIHEMPKNSGDFSGFQMKRLLKRYSVQASLDEAAKEMGGHSLSIAELEVLLKDQGIVTSSGSRIASDENARYLLIKDVRKAMDEAKQQEVKEPTLNNDIEYQKNLEEAIELSLQEEPGTSKNEPKASYLDNFCDGDFRSSSDTSDIEEIPPVNEKLTTAKNYMVEYSGLTPTEIDKIIGNNVSKKKKILPIARIDDQVVDDCTNQGCSTNHVLPNVSDSSDDDFLEVSENPLVNICDKEKEHLEIVIQRDEKVQNEDDLFSDIFGNTTVDSELKNTETTHTFKKDIRITKPMLQLSQNSSATVASSISKTIMDANKTNITNSKTREHDLSVMDCSEFDAATSNIEDEGTESTKTINKELPEVSPDLTQDALNTVELKISYNKTKNTEAQFIKTNLDLEKNIIENRLNKEDNTDELSIKVAVENNIDREKTIVLSDEATCSSNYLTTEDLEDMARNLRNEKVELESGRHAKERLAHNLTDQIYQEAQELLQLFGVPYIIAPMEAEAQCAFLNSINLTDGTITDDSDIWLFGGKTVYKNFFNQQKHVLEYRLEKIQQHFKLSREQMILLALLVGSDYTTGLQGVGPVTALEIIAKFPPTDELISGLRRFRQWLCTDKTGLNLTLRNKLRNVTFTDGFPSLQVVNAYLEPAIDSSEEAFSWAKPDTNGLIEFARQKFGWNRVKSEEILKPVLKRLSETITQRLIKDYFQIKHKIDGGAIEAKMSKRVKLAVDAIGKGTDTDNSEQNAKPKPKSRKKTVKVINKVADNLEENLDAEMSSPKNHNDYEDHKVLQKTIIESKKRVKQMKSQIAELINKPKVAPDLHKKEVIPQKEQAKVDALRSKLKAIEVLRKSKLGPGFIKKRKAVKRKLKVDAELSESSSD